MKKKIFNKITSGVLLTVVSAGLVIGSAKGSHAKVTGIVDNYQRIEPNVWQAYDGEYNKFNVGVDGVKYDPVNGEKALKIQEKANVLANICDNKEKLTVLEIVPYSLASQYSAYIPSKEDKDIIKSYGNELFSAYGQGGSVPDFYRLIGFQSLTVYGRSVGGVAVPDIMGTIKCEYFGMAAAHGAAAGEGDVALVALSSQNRGLWLPLKCLAGA